MKIRFFKSLDEDSTSSLPLTFAACASLLGLIGYWLTQRCTYTTDYLLQVKMPVSIDPLPVLLPRQKKRAVLKREETVLKRRCAEEALHGGGGVGGRDRRCALL